MRYFRITIWHLLLVVLIVVGAMTGVLAGVQALLPAWHAPGLWLLLVLVSVDAVLTQWLVERERQGWSEQLTVRVVEMTLLVVAVRVASVAGEGVSWSLLETWLRDPLSFFGGRFSEYAFIALGVWLTATLLTHRTLQLDTEPPHKSVRGMPIDQAVLLEERALALLQFDRMWIGLTLVCVAGAVAALYQTPLLEMARSWSSLRSLLAVMLCALGGVLLHSEGQLDFVRYRWHIEQLDIAPTITQRWRRTSWLLILGALGLAVFLGGLVRYVPPPPPLTPVINLMLAFLIIVAWLVILVISLLLLPIAWLLSLFRGTPGPSLPTTPPPLPPIASEVGTRSLLAALIFWTCVALLIGIAVLRYLQQRTDVLALLNRWRGWRWLVALAKGVLADVRGWGDVALQALQRLRRPRRRAPVRRRPVRSDRAKVRALYRRMVQLSIKRGIGYRPSQTPYEFSDTLRASLPAIQEETQGLTDTYVAAEYGPQAPSAGDVRRARQWWRRIERVLGRKRPRSS